MTHICLCDSGGVRGSGDTDEEGQCCKWHLGEPAYMVGGTVNWHSHRGKQYGGSLKN